jgi:hypothetical protein
MLSLLKPRATTAQALFSLMPAESETYQRIAIHGYRQLRRFRACICRRASGFLVWSPDRKVSNSFAIGESPRWNAFLARIADGVRSACGAGKALYL